MAATVVVNEPVFGIQSPEDIQIGACVGCTKNFMPGSFATAKTCITCKKFCHQKCLVDDTVCVVCHQQEQIYFQRQGAKRKQEEQANKMLERSAKRFKEAEVGDTVLVPISDLEEGVIILHEMIYYLYNYFSAIQF